MYVCMDWVQIVLFYNKKVDKLSYISGNNLFEIIFFFNNLIDTFTANYELSRTH